MRRHSPARQPPLFESKPKRYAELTGVRVGRHAGVHINGVVIPSSFEYSNDLRQTLSHIDDYNNGLAHHGLDTWLFTIWVAAGCVETLVSFRPPWEYPDPHLSQWADEFRPIEIEDYVRLRVARPDAMLRWCMPARPSPQQIIRTWLESARLQNGSWRAGHSPEFTTRLTAILTAAAR